MTKTDVLTEAHDLIRGERARHYGPPHGNFAIISDFWSAYIGPRVMKLLKEHGGEVTDVDIIADARDLIDSNDVANLMTLLKVAREASGQGYHRDSTTDAAGYQAIKEIIHDFTPDEFVAIMKGV